MPKYIALLRGINVGGHRKIKMDDLKALFQSMGLENVHTYIQSGNVVFDDPGGDSARLSNIIEKQIEASFGHDVPVISRMPEELENALRAFPFEEKEGWKGYISFVEKPLDEKQKSALQSITSDVEKIAFGNRSIYSLINKQSNQKLLFSNSFVEKKLSTHVTTRNLRTVQKVLDLASSTQSK